LGSFEGLAVVKAGSLDGLGLMGEVDDGDSVIGALLGLAEGDSVIGALLELAEGDSVTGALLGLVDGESVTGATLVGVPVTVSPVVGLMVVGSTTTIVGLLDGDPVTTTVAAAAHSFITLSRQI
jgi:hypothetical protein